MIKVGTLLHVIDNSGALVVGCLNIPKLFKKIGGTTGVLITTSVKKNIFKKNITKKSKIITKGQIVKSLIVSTRYRLRRLGNFFIKSSINAVVLLNQYLLPYGTRLFSYIFREIRQKVNYRKLVSLAPLLV